MSAGVFVQIVSLAGAALILIGYIGHQFKWLDSSRAAYNVVNVAGAAMLAYVALHPFSAGFLILEGTWVVVSLYALGKAMRRTETTRGQAKR
jgi:ABC-type nickel/cobalt efflux system permease component RcnA